MEYLSDIELYIASFYSETDNSFEITSEEYHHAIKVMRNKLGDIIYATTGNGQIFKGNIFEITKTKVIAKIVQNISFENEFGNFTICIPNLRNPERLKFALEKSIEFGFTNFIIYNSERTIGKKINKSRLEKISLSAMKQSLHSYFPQITSIETIDELPKTDQKVILFDQSSNNRVKNSNFDRKQNYLLLFGPEGSFSENEIKKINPDLTLNIGKHRLRSETAIIKCVSIISDKFESD